MTDGYDLILIGAGPAGMAAAKEAANHGLSVMVLGEAPLPGGQMYRNIEKIDPGMMQVLGTEYRTGQTLVRRFRSSRVSYVPGATVWQLEPGWSVCYVAREKTRQIRGRRVLIVAGARERPVPICGWTLPGVMAATACDVLLKSGGIIPSKDIVLAGSGPLLLLTAARLLQTGAAVKALLDTTPRANLAASLPYLPRALLAPEYLLKGLALKWAIRRNRVPVYRNVEHVQAVGSQFIEAVRFSENRSLREIKTDILLLHNGLVPDTQLTGLLQCAHRWDGIRRYWRPVVDAWGNTDVDDIGVAGDAMGIAGARAAQASGRLAALEAACALGRISRHERDRKAIPLRKQLAREGSIRPFLDRLFRPAPGLLVPQDDETVVCRCEEVTAGQIRMALKLGTPGPNQLKSQTRTGMGSCQGRMCGLTVSEMIAHHLKKDVSRVGYYRIRPPIKPITVKELANLEL